MAAYTNEDDEQNYDFQAICKLQAHIRGLLVRKKLNRLRDLYQRLAVELDGTTPLGLDSNTILYRRPHLCKPVFVTNTQSLKTKNTAGAESLTLQQDIPAKNPTEQQQNKQEQGHQPHKFHQQQVLKEQENASITSTHDASTLTDTLILNTDVHELPDAQGPHSAGSLQKTSEILQDEKASGSISSLSESSKSSVESVPGPPHEDHEENASDASAVHVSPVEKNSDHRTEQSIQNCDLNVKDNESSDSTEQDQESPEEREGVQRTKRKVNQGCVYLKDDFGSLELEEPPVREGRKVSDLKSYANNESQYVIKEIVESPEEFSPERDGHPGRTEFIREGVGSSEDSYQATGNEQEKTDAGEAGSLDNISKICADEQNDRGMKEHIVETLSSREDLKSKQGNGVSTVSRGSSFYGTTKLKDDQIRQDSDEDQMRDEQLQDTSVLGNDRFPGGLIQQDDKDLSDGKNFQDMFANGTCREGSGTDGNMIRNYKHMKHHGSSENDDKPHQSAIGREEDEDDDDGGGHDKVMDGPDDVRLSLQRRISSRMEETGATDMTSIWSSEHSFQEPISPITTYPSGVEELKKIRSSVAMELLWVQQAINSRKNYLHLKKNMTDG